MRSDAPPSAEPISWDTIEEEILCPLCDYNLRGLIEPRCPECGYRFKWPELLDPAQRLHPYLFEHHPERNIWSFQRTLLGGWRPKKFWTSLHPAQPSRPRRLLGYWFIYYVLFVLLFVCMIFPIFVWMSWPTRVNNVAMRTMIVRQRIDPPIATPGPGLWPPERYSDADLDSIYPTNIFRIIIDKLSLHGYMDYYFGPLLALLIWPWTTFVALSILRASMKQSRVKSIHVLRCVLYTNDFLLWLAPLYSLLYYIAAITVPTFGTTVGSLFPAISFFGLIIWSFRLMSAYRHYLRFPQPVATVILSQLISLGLMAILFGIPVNWL